ncbi:MAG: aminotransferase class V-fold PLP-dependent enzyme [Chloroflexota bacterium]|nr:aminotransferase class V-fold PLP-dependent enzyme [Chloroflexota bacterium]
MEELLRDTAKRATRYLAGLEDRCVGPLPEAIGRLDALAGPFPDGPTDPADVLALLDDIGSPATVASAGGRYFGFVTGGALPAALAANWLAGAWDQNCAFTVMSPVVAALEKTVLDWLRDALRLPAGCGGGFVTGATVANFTALVAARHAVLERVGWDVEADGLFGAPPITVVVGAEVHASLVKALGLVGFGRNRVVTAPVDTQGRMRADALPPFHGPTIVCIQAGNVNTGAFDPAREICAWAHAAGAWVHVDGAFGLWAAAAPDRAHLVDGFADADSWATDAHKWLNVPYDSGLAFVRDPETLRAAMSLTAAYLQQSDGREPNHYTPESSRRARAVDIWAALRSLGRSGLADLIERTCRYAAQMADGLREAGYDILNDVELNQVLVSFGDAETTRRVVAAVQVEGTCWCGSTVWQGRTAMRISISSWATTEADIERSLAAILRIAGEQRV